MDPITLALLVPGVLVAGALALSGAEAVSRTLGRARWARYIERIERDFAARGVHVASEDAADVAPAADVRSIRVISSPVNPGGLRLTGHWDGHSVDVFAESVEVDDLRTVTAWVAAAGRAAVLSDRVNAQSKNWRPVGPGQPVITWSTTEGERVSVWGDFDGGMVLLHPDLRGRIHPRLTIRGGIVRVDVRSSVARVGDVIAALDELTSFYEALPDGSMSGVVATFALSDPSFDVREMVFGPALRSSGGGKASFLGRARRSLHADVRARAAVELGAEAASAAMALLQDEDVDPVSRARAANVVARHAADATAAGIIAHEIATGDVYLAPLWLPAAVALPSSFRPPVAAALLDRLDRARAVGVEHYEAAARMGDDSWVPALTRGFVHDDDAVVIAAIDAIGQLGSVHRVAILRDAMTGMRAVPGVRHTPVRWSRPVVRAAEAAIARIQDRAGGSTGGLSVADDAGGRLSNPPETER